MILKKLLNIQDSNIELDENCVKESMYKGEICHYISEELTYTLTSCEACGVENKDYTIYKNGTQTSRMTLPITGARPTYLLLRKQRFMCKSCDSSFTDQTEIVKKHCHISKQVKWQVTIKSAAESQPLTSIARDCSVSPVTVQRVIDEHTPNFYERLKDVTD